MIEMILDGILAAAGDDDDVFDAGSGALLDRILNQRLVDNGQHFLGLRFRGGEKASAQAGGGKDGFANAFDFVSHLRPSFSRRAARSKLRVGGKRSQSNARAPKRNECADANMIASHERAARNEDRILGIESSCDETAAAIVVDGVKILSSVVASQVEIHRKYGGVVPELASREHLRQIVPVVREAVAQAGLTLVTWMPSA